MHSKLIYIAICLFGLLAAGTGVQAQETDLELAEYYYNTQAYEQAVLYYEQIWKKNKSNRVYEGFLESLIQMGEFEEAEKMVKKKLKTKRDKTMAHVDLGSLYRQIGKDAEAQEEFKMAVKELQPGRSNATRLANALIKMNEYPLALETYEKAKKMDNNGYSFNYELANIQGAMGNHDEMLERFFDLLLDSPNYIQTVQNSIRRNLNVAENENNANILKEKLIRRTQQYPEATIYNEILIWYFNQKKAFGPALIQAKALDKRLDENGTRIINLANAAVNNEDYGTAAEAFEYVLSKGKDNPYYIIARTDMLKAKKNELFAIPGYSKGDVVALEVEYKEAAEELRALNSPEIANLQKDLGHIQAFYLGKSNEAVDVLFEAVNTPGLYPKTQALCKLELADVLLFEGKIWDASLLYSQVELDFKEDPLGHEAKFRNAKISYYTGDFDWAQAQLDVLKASTTKLISNDAIELSLLITDNLALDTIYDPMLMFAEADLLAYQNKDEAAIAKMDSLLSKYVQHSLSDEILLLKGDMAYEKADFDKAIEFWTQVTEFYPLDILADNATFQLADLYENILGDTTKAQELYEKVLLEYPGSLFVVEARKRFRRLRGDDIN